MNLKHLARAIFDPRNISIAADVGGHVATVLEDGRIDPAEVVDATHAAIETAMEAHDVGNKTVYRYNDEHEAVKNAIEDAVERVDNALSQALLDKQITYSELNDLMKEVASAVLEAMDPPHEVSMGG